MLATTTLHYTTLHYTTLHYTTLHYTTLHHATLHLTTHTQLSIRLPPTVDPKLAGAAFKKILEENPPYGAEVGILVYVHMYVCVCV
jgi:hypothetical protein